MAKQGNSSGGRRGAKLLCFRCGWSFENAQVYPAASVRDFLSGALTEHFLIESKVFVNHPPV